MPATPSTVETPTRININNSGPPSSRIGTQLAEYVTTLTWETSTDSQYVLIPFENDFIFGSFIVLEMYEKADTPANTDDLDVLGCPAVRVPDSEDMQPSAVDFYMIEEAVNFASPNQAHSYSLSNFHSALAADQDKKHIQGRGFFLKFTPAAAMTGTFDIRVLVR